MLDMLPRVIPRKCRLKYGVYFILAIFILDFFGCFLHLYEDDFKKEFKYPYDGDVLAFTYQLRHGQKPDVDPINVYNYSLLNNNEFKCKDESHQHNPLNPHLIIIVKSAMHHFQRRNAIRNSWGFERRFSDVLIRTVFSLGTDSPGTGKRSEVQKLIDLEAEKYQDIIQFNFVDTYFNNTVKTMSGIKWCVEFCKKSKFYMFLDDDYYVSVKNVLAFLKNPVNYPEYLEEYNEQLRKIHQRQLQEAHQVNQTLPKNESLAAMARKKRHILDMELPSDAKLFAGFVFNSSPHRHKSSKWFVSLNEYRWDTWPTYVTAGSFIMSREALIEMYYVSLYTKHFRFDDIYLGIVALKAQIEPLHSEEFYFYKATYQGPPNYKYVLASHGYSDPEEMLRVWNEVRANGYV